MTHHIQWTSEHLDNLTKNYQYYLNNKNEAENIFKREWKYIYHKAVLLGLSDSESQKNWLPDEIDNLKEKYFYYLEHKEEAEERFQRSWCAIRTKAQKLEVTSMEINKNCNIFLGINIAERYLSKILKFSGKFEGGEPDTREERAKKIVKFLEEQISSKLYNEIVKELINKRILESTQFTLENKHWTKE